MHGKSNGSQDTHIKHEYFVLYKIYIAYWSESCCTLWNLMDYVLLFPCSVMDDLTCFFFISKEHAVGFVKSLIFIYPNVLMYFI